MDYLKDIEDLISQIHYGKVQIEADIFKDRVVGITAPTFD